VSNDNDDGSAGRKNLFAAPVGRRCALSGEVYPLWLCAFPLSLPSMLPLVDEGSPSPSGTQLESGSSFTPVPIPTPIPIPVVASVVFLRLFFARGAVEDARGGVEAASNSYTRCE
jgi:hypothetical protein